MMNHLKLRSFILWLVFMVPLFAADQGPEQKTVEHAAKDKWIAIDKFSIFHTAVSYPLVFNMFWSINWR